MEVPKRLRPQNWPATIPLPTDGRTGDLSNQSELALIRKEAASLYERLMQLRSGAGNVTHPQTWESLVRIWQASLKFKDLSESTARNYQRYIRMILAYQLNQPEIQPTNVKESDIEAMLGRWSYSPDLSRGLLVVMKALMKKAVREKWRNDDPTVELNISLPKRKINTWRKRDVEILSSACIEAGHPALAALIVTVFHIGQRLGDTRKFQMGKQYKDGAFRFKQAKTGKYVTIPAPEIVRGIVEPNRAAGDYLFTKPGTALPYGMEEISIDFKRIRSTLPEYIDQPLHLRSLRHSCVQQLARAQCEIYEIAAITGHAYATVHQIIEHYLPRDNELAWSAMAKRSKMEELEPEET
jgi:integrase